MCPAPRRTSRDAIVRAARDLLEADGLDGVTMATVAARVGVRPPSLYKHVRDRAALLGAVADVAAAELEAVVRQADPVTAAPADRLRAVATAYRRYAARSPRAAALLFEVAEPSAAPSAGATSAATRPLLAIGAALAGARHALGTARLLAAFIVGFTTMEQAGAFRRGTEVDESFEFAIEALVRGLEST
jgi:AcrR family transcriptional regulator